MDEIRQPGLEARLRGRRVTGLRYEPDAGRVVVELEDGELWVSADRGGWTAYFRDEAAWSRPRRFIRRRTACR